MANMDRLYHMACRLIDELADAGELTPERAEIAKDATAIIKNIETIEAMEGSGHSEGAYRMDRGATHAYNDGVSYRNRDGVGRYASNGASMGTRYSRGGTADQLRMMMDSAQDERHRAVLRQALSQIEQG